MDPILGTIIIFAGNFPPRGWAFCDGSLISIAQNSALFAILGTTYGGDGRTTFGLPDLRGRAPIHAGQGPGLSNYTEGEMGGSQSVSLQVANLPAHNHPATATAQVQVSELSASSDEATNHFLANTASNFYATVGSPGQNLGGVSAAATVGNTGGNVPVSVMQPYLAINYIIAMEGIFPSRP